MKNRRMILSVLLSSYLVCVAPNCGAKILAKENETGASGANKIFAETIKRVNEAQPLGDLFEFDK